ncbi:heterokaryon incompatibility protein-domain-containing protein [Lasiosphaeria ovina]|uniref:Heterokaryon incompatibility protein-domain-containing protein n=1 Tax=Lasiosphaeria ovina TaxID=92902 RepID=A0AAE0JY73_9PEZI|nr:heterokaryon incompatibility protein-domain-containing protein [Lasiosphaeria ovina]
MDSSRPFKTKRSVAACALSFSQSCEADFQRRGVHGNTPFKLLRRTWQARVGPSSLFKAGTATGSAYGTCHFDFNLRHKSGGGGPTSASFESLGSIGTQAAAESHAHVLPVAVVPDEYPFSGDAIGLARKWLFDCLHSHYECRAMSLECPLPKRVLDLQRNTVSLHISSEGETGEYATLSYCWGTSGNSLRTAIANLQEHCDGIRLESLPETPRDAVQLARRLGIRYLWIDALCIIQEGDGGKDWSEQACKMTAIYQDGVLNISAVGGHDCNSGLRPRSSLVVNGPLCTRGWAFQERLVSPATLHFTDLGMIWECCDAMKGEPGAWKTRPRLASKKRDWNGTAHGWPGRQLRGPRDLFDELRVWYLIVEDFSTKQLTFEEDRLPALAGLASWASSALGFTYVAGLWREDLARGLCWKTTKERGRARGRRPQQGLAPTWSWTSTSGVAFCDASPYADSMINVLGSSMEEVYPGTFGQVRNGRLDIEGTIWKAFLRRQYRGGLPCCAAPGLFDDDHGGFDSWLMVDLDDSYEIPPLPGGLECWLLLVMKFKFSGASQFLALEELDCSVSSGNKTYKRIGMVEYIGKRGTLGSPRAGKRVSLTLV